MMLSRHGKRVKHGMPFLEQMKSVGSTFSHDIFSSKREEDETKNFISSQKLLFRIGNETFVNTAIPAINFRAPTSIQSRNYCSILQGPKYSRHALQDSHQPNFTSYEHLKFEKTIQQLTRRVFFSSSPKSIDDKKDNHKKLSTKTMTSYSHESSSPFSTGKIAEIIKSASQGIASFLSATPGVLWYYMTNPRAFKDKMIELKELVKKEANHYWMGTKLLAADLRTARRIVSRTLKGSSLTRRERKQLLRTTSDIFRLVPMSMFVLIPFMEFALPFALKAFPNMLPSTFQDSLKSEENMKKELQTRIAMAGFFQETLQSLANEHKKIKKKVQSEVTIDELENTNTADELDREDTATSFLSFLEQAREGQAIPPEVIIKYAQFFKDELTLDNMSRMQILNMCTYMGIPPYGADSLLRFQLRHRIRSLKEDDQRILWEGIDSLNKMELREACRERGMRSTGLSKSAYKNGLQQWLELSVHKDVPLSLLIMSRTFFLGNEMCPVTSDENDSVTSIADAMSGLEKGVVNEVILEVATREEENSNPDVMKIKLEVLNKQNELINEEFEEREREKVKKEEEKEKIEEMESSHISEELVTNHDKAEIQFRPSEQQAKDDSSIYATVASKKLYENSDEKEKIGEEKEGDEEETELSAEEIDAISQLLSPNAVQSERLELERIKAKMDTNLGVESEAEIFVADENILEPREHPTSMKAPEDSSTSETEMDSIDIKDAEKITFGTPENKFEDTPEKVNEDMLDKNIARLKSKVEDMVGKIELQLSDVEAKIGNKLHFLDKDQDGILSGDEIVLCLRQVLKRNLTPDEAMSIVSDMDENQDGSITVAELSEWLETHKLVKLVEEGRDADVDKTIEKYVQKHREKTKIDEKEEKSEVHKAIETCAKKRKH